MRKTLYVGLAGLAFTTAASATAQDTMQDPAAPTATQDPMQDPAAPTTSPDATQDPAATDTTAYDQPAVETAADPVTEDTPFSGLYIGGSGGFAAQPNDVGSSIVFDRNLDGSFNDVVTTGTGGNAFSPGFCNGRALGNSPAGGCADDDDGVEYYAKVGLDQQVGQIVYGVVAEFGRPEIQDSVTGFSTTPASYTFTREVDWEGNARGRAGFVAGRSTLFYGTFGGGIAKIKRDFITTNTANAFALDGDKTLFGFVGGGGVEQMIGDNLSIGLEYMYHQYKDDDTRVRVTQGTAPATNPFVSAPNTTGTDLARSDEKFRWHSIRATAAFRF